MTGDLSHAMPLLSIVKSTADDPFVVKLVTRAGIFVLIGLAALVMKLLPNRHRQIENFLFMIGFPLVLPMLITKWTGHVDNDDQNFSDGTLSILLIMFLAGVICVLTGGAFMYVRYKVARMRAYKIAWDARQNAAQVETRDRSQ